MHIFIVWYHHLFALIIGIHLAYTWSHHQIQNHPRPNQLGGLFHVPSLYRPWTLYFHDLFRLWIQLLIYHCPLLSWLQWCIDYRNYNRKEKLLDTVFKSLRFKLRQHFKWCWLMMDKILTVGRIHRLLRSLHWHLFWKLFCISCRPWSSRLFFPARGLVTLHGTEGNRTTFGSMVL